MALSRGSSPSGSGKTSPRTVVLDCEAVAALARGRAGMAERLEAARRLDIRVVIPAVVLAELITGAGGDAALWRVVRRFPVVDIDARLAARAGALRQRASGVRRKKRDLTVDAITAALAVALAPSVVITSDAGDMRLLCDGADILVNDLNAQPG